MKNMLFAQKISLISSFAFNVNGSLDEEFHEAMDHLTSDCLLIYYNPQKQTRWIWMLNRIKHFMKTRFT